MLFRKWKNYSYTCRCFDLTLKIVFGYRLHIDSINDWNDQTNDLVVSSIKNAQPNNTFFPCGLTPTNKSTYQIVQIVWDASLTSFFGENILWNSDFFGEFVIKKWGKIMNLHLKLFYERSPNRSIISKHTKSPSNHNLTSTNSLFQKKEGKFVVAPQIHITQCVTKLEFFNANLQNMRWRNFLKFELIKYYEVLTLFNI